MKLDHAELLQDRILHDRSFASRSGDFRSQITWRQSIGSWAGVDFQTVPVSTP